MKLGAAPAFAICVRYSERFINDPKPDRELSGFTMQLGEQSKMVRDAKSGVGTPEILKRRIIRRQTFFELAGFGDRPSANEAAPGPIIVEAVLGADVARLHRRFERGVGVLAGTDAASPDN